MTVALTKTGAHRAPLQFPWRLIKSSAMAHFSRPKFFRRGGRAVECAGLENRKTERSREFESHPLRASSIALLINFVRLSLCACANEDSIAVRLAGRDSAGLTAKL